MHRQESLRQTGIDPYALPNTSVRGKGFIPNLAIPPALANTISNLGVDLSEVQGRNKMEDFLKLDENVVNNFVNRYRYDPKSLTAVLKSLVLKGHRLPLNSGPEMSKYLKSLMLRPAAKQAGLFPDMSNAAVESLAEALTGQEAQTPETFTCTDL